MKTIEIKKQLETLKDEWDRLCLWGGGKNLDNKLLRLETKMEKLEIILNRQQKMERLGI